MKLLTALALDASGLLLVAVGSACVVGGSLMLRKVKQLQAVR